MFDFRRVAIVGCGLIGGSLERTLKARQPAIDIVTLDRGDDVARVAGADLVILATPIFEIIRLLGSLRPHLGRHALVTDTGSTKRAIVEAAAGLRFIGGHPIAGAAASDRDAARADLFEGRPWILTPTTATAGEDLSRLTRSIEALGASVRLLDPAEHDRIFALVSHLPQLVVSALTHVVGSGAGDGGLALAGSGLRDSTRLAASPPEIWRDIVGTNRDHVEDALDALVATLASLKDDRSGERLRAIFESAAQWKRVLDERRSI